MGASGPIVKMHLPEFDFPSQSGCRCPDTRLVLDVGYNVEDLEDTLARGKRMLQHVIDRMDLIDGHVKQSEIGHEHHELTDRQMLLNTSCAPFHSTSAPPRLPTSIMPGE